MPTPMGDAAAQALLHSARPTYAGPCKRKGNFSQHHPNMLAQVEEMDAGNKQKLSEKKADVISTKQKWQRDEGRFQVIKYFNHTKRRY
jgi:hypothetical protein